MTDDHPAPVTPEWKNPDEPITCQKQMDVNVIEGTVYLHISEKKCFRVCVSLKRQPQKMPDAAVCAVATNHPARFQTFFDSSGVPNDCLNRID